MQFLKSIPNRLSSFVHSIRFRLTVWFVAILAVVLAAFSVFIYYRQAADLEGDESARMRAEVERMETYFRSAVINSFLADPNRGPILLQRTDVLTLVDLNGKVVKNWGPAPADGAILALINDAQTQHDMQIYQEALSTTDSNNQSSTAEYLLVISPVVFGNTLQGYLIMGSPTTVQSQLNRLLVSLILGNLGMLVVAFLGGLWLADRAMHPVKTITHTARSISETDLNRRLNLRRKDELGQLADTFDAMLSRLQNAFDRQRRFVADASHELRTPLTIMNLEATRVSSGHRSSADYQHALQVITSENERMMRLVNDLMLLARMDAGQAILQWEDLDLSEAAVEAVERMSALAGFHQVRIETGEMPELIVRGDRQYLIQMISNLLENAIKYSGDGQIIRIRAGVQNGTGRNLAWLRVSDSGPGIPPEHLPHLFERFYRADQARTSGSDESASPTGSGLGLSIVDWILQAHGGEISVTSKVKEGTMFEVRLPLVKAPSPLVP